MTSNQITAELIQKYLAGNCTLEEKARVILWYNSFEKEDNILETLSESTKDQLKLLMFNRINSRIEGQAPLKVVPLRRKNIIYWSAGIAAAFLIFLSINFYHSNNVIRDQANIIEAKLLAVENKGTTIYQRKLEDGTVVWLSPGARIEFPERFAETERKVSMTGKVFFEVAKNPKKPFLIYSGSITTKVLGTSFLINAPKGKDPEVSVVTGKVSVELTDQESEHVFLLPEQKAIFSSKEKSFKKEKLMEESEVNMWKKPRLSFDNVPVKEVIKVLATNFNVNINSNVAINSCLLKADFTDQNLPAILEMLCKSVDASYEINENAISIKGTGCK